MRGRIYRHSDWLVHVVTTSTADGPSTPPHLPLQRGGTRKALAPRSPHHRSSLIPLLGKEGGGEVEDVTEKTTAA